MPASHTAADCGHINKRRQCTTQHPRLTGGQRPTVGSRAPLRSPARRTCHLFSSIV